MKAEITFELEAEDLQGNDALKKAVMKMMSKQAKKKQMEKDMEELGMMDDEENGD